MTAFKARETLLMLSALAHSNASPRSNATAPAAQSRSGRWRAAESTSVEIRNWNSLLRGRCQPRQKVSISAGDMFHLAGPSLASPSDSRRSPIRQNAQRCCCSAPVRRQFHPQSGRAVEPPDRQAEHQRGRSTLRAEVEDDVHRARKAGRVMISDDGINAADQRHASGRRVSRPTPLHVEQICRSSACRLR